jgi:hypothetical protein
LAHKIWAAFETSCSGPVLGNAAATLVNLFGLGLAVNTQVGPGHGFQPLNAYLFLAIQAGSVRTIVHALEGAIDHLQKLGLVLALTEIHFFRVRSHSAVHDIRGSHVSASFPSSLGITRSLTAELVPSFLKLFA